MRIPDFPHEVKPVNFALLRELEELGEMTTHREEMEVGLVDPSLVDEVTPAQWKVWKDWLVAETSPFREAM